MTLREFRMLTAPVSLTAPVKSLLRTVSPVLPRRKRITIARRTGEAKVLC